MMKRTIAGIVGGALSIGSGSAAWAAAAPLENLAKAAVVQPAGEAPPAGEVPPADLPPPARTTPPKKNSFFAGPGIALLAAGAGTGVAVAASNNGDEEPVSP